MNEREKFLKSYYARIERIIDAIATMSEVRVLNTLRAIQAGRNAHSETLAFLKSVAIQPAKDSERGIHQLRSELSSRAERGDEQLEIFDSIEDALKKRLEALRRQGK